MYSLADISAVTLRALSFVAVLQAAGAAVFFFLFCEPGQASHRPIQRLCAAASIAGLVLGALAQIVAPVRLIGDFSGIFDGQLQSLMLTSDAGAATAVRLAGLALILFGAWGRGRIRMAAAMVGATLAVVSFAIMGHTASDAGRWYLAVGLIAHVWLAAFWFGALWPLLRVLRYEEHRHAAVIVESFSRLAVRLVPVVALAGAALAVVLLPSWSGLLAPYGRLILLKAGAFVLLMFLASLNKWRLGPGIARNDANATSSFATVVRLEWWTIAGVLIATAAMTSFYSPESG